MIGLGLKEISVISVISWYDRYYLILWSETFHLELESYHLARKVLYEIPNVVRNILCFWSFGSLGSNDRLRFRNGFACAQTTANLQKLNSVYRRNPYGQPRARLTDLPTKKTHRSRKAFFMMYTSSPLGQTWSKEMLPFPGQKKDSSSCVCDLLWGIHWSVASSVIEGGHPLRVDENLEHCRLAIVASTLSNLDSFSRLMRKKYLTPSHLKLTNLTPSRIISPRLISPHLIIPHLTSSHLIITLFPWSHLTLCHLTLILLHHMSRHDIWSHLTSSHLENALKSIIQSTKNGEFCA